MNKRMLHSKSGQSILEYSLIITLIVLASMLLISVTGNTISGVFCLVVRGLNPQTSGSCAYYLSDKFANMNNWLLYWGSPGWSLSNGQLVMTGDNRLVNKTLLPNDYRVIADKAQLVSGNGYGLMFRMNQSGYNYSGYSFQIDPGYGNAFVFRRYDQNGAELSTPLSTSHMPANFNLNAPHKVEVVVVGSTFQAYVDGSLVLTANDSTYTSGQVGLRTWDTSVARYDNLTVTPP